MFRRRRRGAQAAIAGRFGQNEIRRRTDHWKPLAPKGSAASTQKETCRERTIHRETIRRHCRPMRGCVGPLNFASP
jgi:hypothetical protein